MISYPPFTAYIFRDGVFQHVGPVGFVHENVDAEHLAGIEKGGSYSIVTPESPAAAVMLSEKAAAQKQRQTAMAITAATIRVICPDAIMLLPPYPMYLPL